MIQCCSRWRRKEQCNSCSPTCKFTLKTLWTNVLLVLPIASIFFISICAIFRRPVPNLDTVLLGLLCAIFGLALFIHGLRFSLMPLGKTVGSGMQRRFPAWLTLTAVMLLGVLVTYAEPAIGALLSLSALIQPDKTPHLFLLLHQWSEVLVLCIGVGMGISAVLGTLRLLYDLSLRVILIVSFTLLLSLNLYMTLNEDLWPFIGLSVDIGSIVTGPVAIPVLISLGLGIASSSKHKRIANDPLSGFGMVAIATVWPSITTQILSIILVHSVPRQVAVDSNLSYLNALNSSSTINVANVSPLSEVLFGLRAILPTTFALILLCLLVKERLPSPTIKDFILETESIDEQVELDEIQEIEISNVHPTETLTEETETIPVTLRKRLFSREYKLFWMAVLMTQIGIILFNWGLSYCFNPLGSQGGSLFPGAFSKLPADSQDREAADLSPYFTVPVGLTILTLFILLFSVFIVHAEPALYIFANEVQLLTGGRLKAWLLKALTSIGCATGLILGVAALINYQWNLGWIVFGLGVWRLLLTAVCHPTAISIAWDSSGIASGPISVPFVLSMGLGFLKTIRSASSDGSTANTATGFGLLALIGGMTVVVMLAVLLAMDKWRQTRQRSTAVQEESI